MGLGKNVFFAAVALMVAVAAALQFFLVYEFNEQCDGHDISTAPTVAGACLAGSFILNGAWLWARKNQMKTSIRAAIFAWTFVVTVGVAAAGAVLGQTYLYDDLCVDGQGASTLVTEIDIETLQYVSIVLLVFAIAAPHALKKKATDVGRPAGALLNGVPLTSETPPKPLVFL